MTKKEKSKGTNVRVQKVSGVIEKNRATTVTTTTGSAQPECSAPCCRGREREQKHRRGSSPGSSSTPASSVPSSPSSLSNSPVLSSCSMASGPAVVTTTHATHPAKPGGVVRFSDRPIFAKRRSSASASASAAGTRGPSPTTPVAASSPDSQLLLFDEDGRATPRTAKFMSRLAEYVVSLHAGAIEHCRIGNGRGGAIVWSHG